MCGLLAEQQNWVYMVIGGMSVVIVAILVGVLVSAQRKRAHGTPWFPENFFGNNSPAGINRRVPDGGEEDDCKLDGIGEFLYILL